MPTVLKEGQYGFVSLSTEVGQLPHIHVRCERRIAKFCLRPVELVRNRGFAAQERNHIARLVADHERFLWEAGMSSLVHEIEPVAVEVSVTADDLLVRLADGRRLGVPLTWYPRLLYASEGERQHWQLLGDGYAIEWPDLDEHIGIEGLLAGRASAESHRSLQRWMESRGITA